MKKNLNFDGFKRVKEMTISITVSWEVWIDGENRFQTFLKNKKKEPNYVTIKESQIKLIDWKDSQKRVSKFKLDNSNKNPLTVKLSIATSTTEQQNMNEGNNSITVPWEVWIDGDNAYQTYLKNNEKEPSYMTINKSQVELIDWKDSQKRVSNFKQENNAKNPLTVRLTIPSLTIVSEQGIVDIITPPNSNRGVTTDGYYHCSCGEKGYEYGRWKVGFINKCAHADDSSHKYKSSKLVWSKKTDVAPKEGQWTCEGCDADYCAVCGKEKLDDSNKRLTKVSEEKIP